MSPHTQKASFGEKSPQDQPAQQAAPGPRPGTTTIALAERHEALWLSLAALHKDTMALGAKKLTAVVPEILRIAAEGLLSDCVPFSQQGRRSRLPVAASDMGGLAVQLGQALATLEAWQSQHSFVDARYNCLMWRVTHSQLPIMRLKPPAAALPVQKDVSALRDKLARRIDGQRATDFQRGFEAGRAARHGKPLVEIEAEFKQTYPRIRLAD